MAIIINEFEVIPEPQRNDRQKPEKNKEKSEKNKPLSEHELKKILDRVFERLERISAN